MLATAQKPPLVAGRVMIGSPSHQHRARTHSRAKDGGSYTSSSPDSSPDSSPGSGDSKYGPDLTLSPPAAAAASLTPLSHGKSNGGGGRVLRPPLPQNPLAAVIRTGIQSVKVCEGGVELESGVPYLYRWPDFHGPMDDFNDDDLESSGFFILAQYGPTPLLEILGRRRRRRQQQQQPPLDEPSADENNQDVAAVTAADDTHASIELEADQLVCQGAIAAGLLREPVKFQETTTTSSNASESFFPIENSSSYPRIIPPGKRRSSSCAGGLLTLVSVDDDSREGVSRAIEVPSFALDQPRSRLISTVSPLRPTYSAGTVASSVVGRLPLLLKPDDTISSPPGPRTTSVGLASPPLVLPDIEKVEIVAEVTPTCLWIWRGRYWSQRQMKERLPSDNTILHQFKMMHGILPSDPDVIEYWEEEGHESDALQKLVWLG